MATEEGRMTPERWAQIEELYRSVVGKAAEEREIVLNAVRARGLLDCSPV